MSEPLFVDETTILDLTHALFGNNQHMKLARCAVEHFIDQYYKYKDARVDMATLRNFIEFLIKERGYN